MPRKLTTNWVKVATSGPTVDGREIPAQDIVDMAEGYDPAEYTANIWYEHIRIFGNLGKVVALKARADDKGRQCLFARLAPTDELLFLNNNGQKLFTSIEIQPEFAGTGKAYLAGLAVTDSPASLGTTELQFKRALKPDNYFARPIALDALELEDSQGLLSRLLQSFGRDAPSEPEPQEAEPMDEQQFNTLKTALESLQQQFARLENRFAGQPEASGGDHRQGGENGADVSAPVSQEEFQSLLARVDALAEKFGKGGDPAATSQTELATLSQQIQALGEQFNKALNTETPGTIVPQGTGDGGHPRVL
ncbi:GPO family capsid scaffolding protein [Microbulbifer spongiae]|uniref:GPO family capsid scaffolding protein n=1 Tax=Microbulbifer spongiae TaxID=2944933 RepID=A0ABY9E8B4_9GAMM|nr:GPO family capsid scaffolding protein [Microbulbifer sp. MI-G]WKD48348.1 GPO family capsid scaffolding protein [Microbulbifer sp. MI-G]